MVMILGRDDGLSRLGLLLDAAFDGGPNVLVLTGEPGVGKSTLVEWTAQQGVIRGMRTLLARGSRSESGSPLAAIQQLLRRIEPDVPDTHAGVANLLSDTAKRQPLLLLVDDLQGLDHESVAVLSFVARRIAGESIAVLLAAREDAVPDRFDRDFPTLVAEPLDRPASGRLLDAQPHPPHGRVRVQILEQAAGNPLALIELTRAVAGNRDGDLAGSQSLPLTKRLVETFAADLPDLPAPTRKALLLFAAGATRWSQAHRADPDLVGEQSLEAAERAGLVRIEAGRVIWRHPVTKAAVYWSASFAERRAAHLALAAVTDADTPEWRARHLAAAALGQDEDVAAELARGADRAESHGAQATAATLRERAAELTPDPAVRARRLLAAAQAAMLAGYPQWAGDLAGQVTEFTQDPEVRARAALSGGWALGITLRHDEALALLFSAVESLPPTDPAQAADALVTAATSVYHSGDPFHRSEFERLWAPVSNLPEHVERAWPIAMLHPHTRRAAGLDALRHSLAGLNEVSPPALVALGSAAWILDETDTAVRLLGRALDQVRRSRTGTVNASVALALATALFESGTWASAAGCAEDAFLMATEAEADCITVESQLLRATLRALSGAHEEARSQALNAVKGIDLRKARNVHVRYRYALGMAALVAGDMVPAYEQLRSVFTRDFQTSPIHYHASVYYLGDLASAAVRAHRADDARTVMKAVEQTIGPGASPRAQAILHRGAALLSGDDHAAAEEHFLAALEDPACTRWPFEHALVQLDYGEWLRRRRRAAEARPRLATALEIFQRLDACPWLDRATAELRAAGGPTTPPAADSPGADLTPQELQIAQLAAQGLTNRDIATRLFLSPRTVGFHLHKIFPKLGITARAQLRDALAEPPRPVD
ncbi:DNA-binding CsgD family transcriptional regulator [Catenulispora sp. GP43]|uniref:helix-turn-helix transcriptional regulator n=1 Tax=Catenulispora sp. GP43 TaxID=3156263 RepID=UPI003517641F